jgi:pimeloyl-ACP methyl ester carboxylesterase
MPFFEVDDQTRLFYTVDGNGPPLLLIHGWGCDSHDWSHQIPAFATDHRVIAADNRGHGRSTGSTGFEPRIFAADLAALLEKLDSGPAVVVGHSLGAAIGSVLAVEYRHLVSALVAIDPAYGLGPVEEQTLAPVFKLTSTPGDVDAIAELFPALSLGSTPAHLTTWHRRRALGTPNDVIRQTFTRAYLAEDQICLRPAATRYFANRICPVLAIYRIKRSESAGWEQSIAKTPLDEVHVLESGHWIHQERPDEVNAIIRRWMTARDGAHKPGPSPA